MAGDLLRGGLVGGGLLRGIEVGGGTRTLEPRQRLLSLLELGLQTTLLGGQGSALAAC